MREIDDIKKQSIIKALRKWVLLIGIVALVAVILSWSSWDTIRETLSKQAWVFLLLILMRFSEESIWKDHLLMQMTNTLNEE